MLLCAVQAEIVVFRYCLGRKLRYNMRNHATLVVHNVKEAIQQNRTALYVENYGLYLNVPSCMAVVQ